MSLGNNSPLNIEYNQTYGGRSVELYCRSPSSHNPVPLLKLRHKSPNSIFSIHVIVVMINFELLGGLGKVFQVKVNYTQSPMRNLLILDQVQSFSRNPICPINIAQKIGRPPFANKHELNLETWKFPQNKI